MDSGKSVKDILRRIYYYSMTERNTPCTIIKALKNYAYIKYYVVNRERLS